MVKQFNKSNLPKIRAIMKVALAEVENQFGVRVDVGNCSYVDHDATFKVKLFVLDEVGDNKADKSDFMAHALFRGFDAEDFGRDFTSKGRQFKITGWNNRKWKFPVTVKEIVTGRPWHFPVDTVLRALDKGGK